MRILLAHNSTYYPSHGGGDKSNRLLMEALAERGHDVRVVTRVERFGAEHHESLLGELARRGVYPDTSDPDGIRMALNGVDVRVLTLNSNLRAFFSRHIAEFEPDIIVTSTDDPGQLLFDLAINAPRARVVHLVRATIAVPFGPESSAQSTAKTAALRFADGVVGVSNYVASYVRKWSGIDAIHVPISLLDRVGDYPNLGSFENRYVSMVNPCAVKGIGIFLELADRMPDVEFAAVPTWGTTKEDLPALERRENITVLAPFDDIDDLLRMTKVLLVPSVWAEARSRLLMESMSRGVPVIASDIGGLRESHLGVDHLIPITPIEHYQPQLDMNLVPVPDVPPQNIEPWERILRRVFEDREHFEELSAQSRAAAIEYANNLNVLPFEAFLEEVRTRPKKDRLSEEKKKLLALRLRERLKPAASEWFSGIEDRKYDRPLLLCFPYAGGGAMAYRGWRDRLADMATVVAVRAASRKFQSMGALIDALSAAVLPYLDQPFLFFGHSMGATIAFELARRLRGDGKPLPQALFVSAARAPQFRLNYEPPPEPSEEAFINELRRLGGMPPEVLNSEDLMKITLPSLQADARLYRNYVYRHAEPFRFPVFAYRGSDDPSVGREHMERWAEQTTGQFRYREFPGGHFYIHTSDEFPATFAEDLRRIR